MQNVIKFYKLTISFFYFDLYKAQCLQIDANHKYYREICSVANIRSIMIEM